MIFRQLTSSGDWTFGKGINGYAVTENAIELNIRTRLLSWKGNCFFSLDDFVDWLSRLDKGQEDNLSRELRTVILQSFGVVSADIVSVNLDRATRNMTITYRVTTIYGQTFSNTLNMAAGSPIGLS